MKYLDPLYGDVELPEDISRLACTPVVQRLRHVRQSNIDSLGMPGIANVSRYEHVLGVAHVAGQTSLAKLLTPRDRTILQAAALLHDAAITPFGHLIEEAMSYGGSQFHHEQKWSRLLDNNDADAEIGSVDLQIYCGRESGLRPWAERAFSTADSGSALREIFDAIMGHGLIGRAIAVCSSEFGGPRCDLTTLFGNDRLHLGKSPDLPVDGLGHRH